MFNKNNDDKRKKKEENKKKRRILNAVLKDTFFKLAADRSFINDLISLGLAFNPSTRAFGNKLLNLNAISSSISILGKFAGKKFNKKEAEKNVTKSVNETFDKALSNEELLKNFSTEQINAMKENMQTVFLNSLEQELKTLVKKGVYTKEEAQKVFDKAQIEVFSK